MTAVGCCADCGRLAFHTSAGRATAHGTDCPGADQHHRVALRTGQLASAQDKLADAHVTIGRLRERLAWLETAVRDLPVAAASVPSPRRLSLLARGEPA